MLSNANIDVIKTLQEFKSNGVKVAFLVPTITGLNKSIMDATISLKNFLESSGLHNYTAQQKGELHKVVINTKLIINQNIIETKTSLYRPETKNGDPRIWIYSLKKYVEKNDLLAVTSLNANLIVINCSKTNLSEIFLDQTSILFKLKTPIISSVANELLDRLKEISKKGFIRTLKKGDTGVGYTLESLLGIKANSLQIPDYKGIELKSLRKRSTKGTLFSKVPDWSLSNIKSAKELVQKRGKKNLEFGNLITLNHTINSIRANSYNLKLDLDGDYVHQVFIENNTKYKDVCWSLSALNNQLKKKHKETFWVDVETKGSGANEEFYYNSVLHTSEHDTDMLLFLIDTGSITVDYILWEKRSDWRSYINKKGYDFLWKVKNKDRDTLFETVKKYELS